MAVTIKQLSEHCGLSASAVSKALNGYGDISEDTRRRVLQAAAALGYRPSAIARALKTGRTYNLGVVYSEYSGSGFTHSYFSPVLEAFKAEAERRGYDITFITRTVRADKQEPLSYLQHSHYRNVDGICIVCCDFYEEQVRELLHSGMPVVTIDHPFPGHTCISSQNGEGMLALTRHVIAMGHRRIAFVYGSPSPATSRRLESFQAGMQAAGLAVPDEYLVQNLYHNPQATREAVRGLLALGAPPTCILLPDDFAALGGLEAIAAAGLRIPGDISVAGFDGVQVLQMCRPQMTTVAQDTANIGREAARHLVKRIERPDDPIVEMLSIPTALLTGQTVARLGD